MKKFAFLLAAVLTLVSAQAKTLVVYYSFTGNTNQIVDELTKQIEADVIHVEPAEEGLDYAADNYALGSSLISAIRNNPDDAASYPAIKPTADDFSVYDTVIIGAPLWWSQMAAPLQSFLFKYGRQFAGKNIGLIVSSHSSGIRGVVADAKRLIPNGKFLEPALWIKSAQTDQAASLLKQWLTDINYNSLATNMNNALYIKVGSTILNATLVENSSTAALKELLADGPLTIHMHDYGNFEKVGELPETLPRNDEDITTEAGDLILYLGRNFVIYYDTNTWDFTRLGKINDVTGSQLKQILGDGDVDVTISTSNGAGLKEVSIDLATATEAFDMKGNRYDISSTGVNSLSPGVYIINGVKTLIP